ncbi:MAG: hypothetical protein M1837_003752 [Sclerophora amabilis]|nr:MAG: hypothetical protein M1837_003752 [Sclerophora amabilis]
MPVTPQMLQMRREKDCVALTAERKYYHVGRTFIKRSLRPSEWQTSPFKGTLHVPRQGRERALNEAAAMEYVATMTDVPVPKLLCSFEDDQAVYLVMEYVEGVSMHELNEEQRDVVPPFRVTRKTGQEHWDLTPSESEEFVFCHNDLSMQNTIVDPVSLKIRAIIDWEYSGFYPEFFERKFYERLGPSIALDGEEDDSDKMLVFLNARRVSL